MIMFESNSKILFMGDSITDTGRDRENPENMGRGYAYMLAGMLGAMYAELDLKFYNQGISGNRVCDLVERWQSDCIEFKPDVLSILIGVNDVWRRYDSNNPTDVDSFKNGYKQILQQTKDDLGCQIVIMEPFVLPVSEDRKEWREDLDPKIGAIRELAAEYADAYVPLDGIFASASTLTGPAYWSADGVHPNEKGHFLIADNWVEFTGLA